jgi:O-antigen biosynthesis protein
VEAAGISLCMIVRDEERVLADCLASMRPFFKEIIVVDTGSSDHTPEIAQEFGATVHRFPWTDSFAEARNESLRHATGKWIFWTDADDTLTLASGEEIVDAALRAPDDVAAWVVPVQFVDAGPAGGTRVDHVKLLRNFPGLAFEGRIHEQVMGSLDGRGRIGRLERAVVLHSGYDTSEEGQARKRERDWHLLKLDLEERPEHPFVHFNLGMTAHYTGEHAEAVGWLERSLTLASPTESHVRKAYALIGAAKHALGDLEGAVAALDQGLFTVGRDPEISFRLGMVLTELGRLEEAERAFLSVEPDGEHFSSIDVGILGFKRSSWLGRVHAKMGRYAKAREWFLRALEENPLALELADELFELAQETGDYPTCGKCSHHAYRAEGPSPRWVRFETARSGALGLDRVSALRALVRAEPSAVSPRLQLARDLLATGAEAEAVSHLAALERVGCAEAAFHLGVHAARHGDFKTALSRMRRANELNPAHEQTRQQVAALERAAAAPESGAKPDTTHIPAKKASKRGQGGRRP